MLRIPIETYLTQSDFIIIVVHTTTTKHKLPTTMPPRLHILPRLGFRRRCYQVTNTDRLLLAQRLYSTTTATPPSPLLIVTNLRTANSRGHVRVIELNRPAARNAISKALLAALRAEVEDVQAQYTSDGRELPLPPGVDSENGPTRALILASAVDSSFCAGADLKERRGFTPEE